MEIKDRIKEFKRVPFSELSANPKNWRKHPEKQRDAMTGVLKTVGWADAVLARETKDGLELIDGHLRKEIAEHAEVPVLVLDVNEEEADLILATHDPLAEMAKTDQELLNDLVSRLEFDDEDTNNLLDSLSTIPSETLEEDDEIEVPDDPETNVGDLWILGEHRLLCGDCTDAVNVARLMNGIKAAACITDPPYNIDYGNIKHPKFKVRNIDNDNMSGDDYRTFCQKFIAQIKANVTGCIYAFGAPAQDGRIFFTELDNAFHCSTTVIWNKDVFTLGRGKYQNKYEPCWFGWNEDGANFTDDRKLTNVWDFERPKRSSEHPTMKPVGLIQMPIEHATKKGDIVFDPFLGSGTTLVASEKLGRICYGLELSPNYCDVIVKRWEEITGQKAKREEQNG